MTTITYRTKSTSGQITWAVSEYFGELTDHTYPLAQMEATQIELLPDLSLTAKLLLSAVAGAVIQHLLDQNIPAAEIFSTGQFTL